MIAAAPITNNRQPPVNEDMEELKDKVDRLGRAIFGDHDRPKEQPGLLADVHQIDSELKHTNTTLEKIGQSVNAILWLIITTAVPTLLALLFKLT